MKKVLVSLSPVGPKEGIRTRGLSFAYGPSKILRNISFEVPKGQTAVVTGSNGTGKSTLLYACAGLLPLQRGIVTLGGRAPDPFRPSELFRAGVRCGFVFQEGGLLSNMNTLANVAFALHYHADVLGLSLEQIEERTLGALKRVRVDPNHYYSLPAHLSFGVRRRIALARAMALKPNFFFFDDPDVGLDPDTAALVHEILTAYRDDPEVTMLVATNRELLIDRLRVPGYRLQGGELTQRSMQVA
jgi:phospholipid/cholesterol/gamma-HCH transport system ATP-binding protein